MGLYCSSCYEEYFDRCTGCHNFDICSFHITMGPLKPEIKTVSYDICHSCDGLICEKCMKKYCCTQTLTENSDDEEFKVNLCVKCMGDTL